MPEHTEDCLIYETNECTCDVMTDEQMDEQIDAELLEKELAKE